MCHYDITIPLAPWHPKNETHTALYYVRKPHYNMVVFFTRCWHKLSMWWYLSRSQTILRGWDLQCCKILVETTQEPHWLHGYSRIQSIVDDALGVQEGISWWQWGTGGYIYGFVFGYFSDIYNTFLIFRCVLAKLQRRHSGMLDMVHNTMWDPPQLSFVSNEHTPGKFVLKILEY